jgi:hypothetical protein
VSGINVGVIAKRFKKAARTGADSKIRGCGTRLGRSTGCRQVELWCRWCELLGAKADDSNPELANFDAVNRGMSAPTGQSALHGPADKVGPPAGLDCQPGNAAVLRVPPLPGTVNGAEKSPGGVVLVIVIFQFDRRIQLDDIAPSQEIEIGNVRPLSWSAKSIMIKLGK